MSEDRYDFIVGFTIFKSTGFFKTIYRHFDNLEVAKMFASNKNLKDVSKVYVDLEVYNKEIDNWKAGMKIVEKDKNNHIERLEKELEQEKNNNKKLDKENQALFEAYNFNDTNLLAKVLKEYKKELKNSISKNKIREFIKEETKEGTYNFKSISAKRLKELLKEEN